MATYDVSWDYSNPYRVTVRFDRTTSGTEHLTFTDASGEERTIWLSYSNVWEGNLILPIKVKKYDSRPFYYKGQSYPASQNEITIYNVEPGKILYLSIGNVYVDINEID